MRRQILSTAAAVLCAGALAAAQNPGNPGQRNAPPQPGAGAQAEARGEQGATTLTGCVYREDDVPGRTPNVAERVGVLEDYILAEVSMKPAATKPGATASTSGQERPGAVATSGAKIMYKLELIDDEKLQAMVGKRVEVMGKIDAESGDLGVTGTSGRERAGDDKDQSIGPDQIELPEFEVSSIREIAGTCPATPSK